MNRERRWAVKVGGKTVAFFGNWIEATDWADFNYETGGWAVEQA